MSEKQLERIEINSKLIGKTVKICSRGEEFFAEILEFADGSSDTFWAKRGQMLVKVDIFDIRETK